MGIRLARLVLLAVLVAGGATGSFAGPALPLVRVDLVSEAEAIAPGATFWVGLRQRITPGWHTYWINPGDSGEPPRIEWTLPEGFVAGDIRWPHPERIPVGPAMSYGYSDEVVLPIPLRAPDRLTPGDRVTLRGQASWLVCEKTCVPGEAAVALTLPVAAGAPAPDPRTAQRQAGPTAVLLDPTGTVGQMYGATNTPHMYVIDKTGILVYAGAIDDRPTSRQSDVQGANNYVRAALQSVATGQPVKTPITRAYGCSVKYS